MTWIVRQQKFYRSIFRSLVSLIELSIFCEPSSTPVLDTEYRDLLTIYFKKTVIVHQQVEAQFFMSRDKIFKVMLFILSRSSMKHNHHSRDCR